MEIEHTDEIVDPMARIKIRKKKKFKMPESDIRRPTHSRPYTPELLTSRA